MDSETASAARIHDDRPGFHQVHQISSPPCLAVNLPRGGEDEHPHVLRDLLSLEDLRRHFEVIETTIGAGADDDLVDFRTLDFVYRSNVIDRVRAGDLRRQRGDIDLDDLFVVRVGVG